MGDMKHAPGPWSLRCHTNGNVVDGSDEWTVIASDGKAVCYESSYNEFAPANSRLIAAAPDLLNACLSVVDSIEGGETTPQQSVANIRAAIAKATGGEA